MKTRYDPGFYDTISAGHDFRALTSKNFAQKFWHKERFEKVIKKASINKNSIILDLGCGCGALLSKINSEAKFGIDISKTQIEFAKKISGANVVQADCEKIPFKDNFFDAVLCSELIEHLPEKKAKKMVKEAKRILKPGGIFVLTTPNYSSHWPIIEFFWSILGDINYKKIHISKFDKKKIEKIFQESGLEKAEIETFFVISPFFAFTEKIGKMLMKMENVFLKQFGTELLATATKK